MDRFAAMIILLGVLMVGTAGDARRFGRFLTEDSFQSFVLVFLALFTVAPVTCSCILALLYTLYLFVSNEDSSLHHAQEFENRFWTIFAVFLSAALFYAHDSPIAFGRWSPTLGFVGVLVSGYIMHLWDRYLHRVAMSRQLRATLRRAPSTSLTRLREMGIPVEEQLARIHECLKEIDQLLIPSTINNFINLRFIMSKERDIIRIFEECDARALNYLISHVKLGLIFYKIKDHRSFNGKHRTELINLLADERLSILTVVSKVIILHSLQLLRLRASPRAEYWVRNILLNTHQEDLSELKTLTDAKGDYFCMNKLIFDDIRSESIRQDILMHIRKEAAMMQTKIQMGKKPRKVRQMHWRKVLSDVDDTLTCSAGMYPAGVDRRFPKKTVYPGVLAFYRELDLGTQGTTEWQEENVGNLVFLSARPHLYKDMSEKANFAKFEKLRLPGVDGRMGLHTTPSLLSGDIASGSSYIVSNDFEPLAKKKFDNFRRYVSIYPEYQHVFVCDNGQGDVRAGEMMFDGFPYEFEGLYVHKVMDVTKTYGYEPSRWKQKEFTPFFFTTYPEAALHAATRSPPLIRLEGLSRVCSDAVKDFAQIKNWASDVQKAERALELNQAVWTANNFLRSEGRDPVEMVRAERKWHDGQKVRTPYGVGTIKGFDPTWDLYDVELDWRPLNVQVAEASKATAKTRLVQGKESNRTALETVIETEESCDDLLKASASLEAEPSVTESSPSPRFQQGGQPSGERTEQNVVSPPPSPARPLSIAIPALESDSPATGRAGVLSPKSPRSPDGTSLLQLETGNFDVCPARARITGRQISKYTPPVLPKTRSGSIFTFFGTNADGKPADVSEGDRCTTPYGPAKVIEYRKSKGIVVVEMHGWKATAYLQRDLVKVVPKTLLSSIFRQFSGSDDKPKPKEFPHVEGTVIATPYGPGTVSRPIPVLAKLRSGARPPTLGISLESWTLADGSHPTLYCTVESAKEWKERKTDEASSLFTTLGTLVTSSRSLIPFLQQSKKPVESKPAYKQYYKDAAAVTTPVGDGRVLRFRPEDGIYEVVLQKWTLADGSKARSYLRKEDISYRIASGCHEGYPVLTTMGMSGTLASVEPTTGVHIVTVSAAKMVCYLQPECIVKPLKAAVGEDVSTPYGEGNVLAYDLRRDIYTIGFTEWTARLYCTGDKFERAGDSVPDRDGPFGVNWLLRFFFSSDSSAGTRSRSNSVASGTHSIVSGTHSSRSLS